MRNRHYVQHLERVFKFWVKKFRFLCTFPFVNLKTNSNDQNKQEQCENRKQYAELDAISCICCTAVVLCCDALRSQQYRNFPWNCLTVFYVVLAVEVRVRMCLCLSLFFTRRVIKLSSSSLDLIKFPLFVCLCVWIGVEYANECVGENVCVCVWRLIPTTNSAKNFQDNCIKIGTLRVHFESSMSDFMMSLFLLHWSSSSLYA